MYIYLIRHAQSEGNLLNLSTPISTQEYNEILRHGPAAVLTQQGVRQAQTVGEHLRHAGIEQLYSSPYPRALATAQIIGRVLQLPVQVVDDLYEVQAVPLKESQRKAAVRCHFVHSYLRMLWPWNQEETWIKHYRRAQRIWAWVEVQPAQTVALVSHGWFIGLLLLSIPRQHHWHILQRNFSNGGISLVTNENKRQRSNNSN